MPRDCGQSLSLFLKLCMGSQYFFGARSPLIRGRVENSCATRWKTQERRPHVDSNSNHVFVVAARSRTEPLFEQRCNRRRCRLLRAVNVQDCPLFPFLESSMNFSSDPSLTSTRWDRENLVEKELLYNYLTERQNDILQQLIILSLTYTERKNI